ARTECPTLASSVTRARPTKPDAPVTRMRVTACLEQSDSTPTIIGAAPAPWQACRPKREQCSTAVSYGAAAIKRQEPVSAPSPMAKRARSKAPPQKAPSSDGLATSVYNRRRKVSFGPLVKNGWFSATPDDTDISRAIRTNNPGALNLSTWQRTRPGFVGQTPAAAAANIHAIYRTPEQGIAAWTYRDVAITPPEKDEFERLSLYHETTGGEAALARKRRDDVIRAGGHVYETSPLAKDMTMATPAE